MKLTFTGDILIYESQDKSCRLSDGKYDYKSIFEQVKPLLDSSDYVVGSFETTTAGKNVRYTHEPTSFNTPDGILSALKWSGFDLLTTANNHCLDRGLKDISEPLKRLKSMVWNIQVHVFHLMSKVLLLRILMEHMWRLWHILTELILVLMVA